MKHLFNIKNSGTRKIVNGFSTKFYGDLSVNNPESKKNFKNFALDLEIDPLNSVRMEQVHGSNIEWVNEDNRGWRMLKTDGLITKDSNVFLVVECADCFPVLFVDLNNTTVGAIHTGWRGVYADIVVKAVEEYERIGISTQNIRAYIGPGIRDCCYLVNHERLQIFQEKFDTFSDIYTENKNNIHLNLPAIIKQQLLNKGLKKENIEDSLICTADNKDFFSYRRDKGTSFRFVALIGII